MLKLFAAVVEKRLTQVHGYHDELLKCGTTRTDYLNGQPLKNSISFNSTHSK